MVMAAIVISAALAEAREPAEVVRTYCVTCHNDRAKTGGLSLEQANFTDIPKGAETWEKVIRKVRAGMMPPAGAARPEAAELSGLAAFLETSLDRAAEAKPRPGRTVMHRLNRTEYANAIRDLLALDVDAAALLVPGVPGHQAIIQRDCKLLPEYPAARRFAGVAILDRHVRERQVGFLTDIEDLAEGSAVDDGRL
jgi:cytochrome c551/c552